MVSDICTKNGSAFPHGCLSQLPSHNYPMRLQLSSWLLLLFVSVILANYTISANGQCLEDQRLLLLQFKQNLSFNPSASIDSKLVSWNPSTDCCSWEGITCDSDTGHVIFLDLSNKEISGGIDHTSSLFELRYLLSLNLANNSFNSTKIPSGFSQLHRLTYLNLSNSGFAGQIPTEISHLTMLVSLDLSTISPGWTSLKLENPDLRTLVQNLSGLRTLRLDGVQISTLGKEWCQALSSALPNLQVLSLSNCSLAGPLDSSLTELHFLSQIRLDQNDISSEVPQYFGNFLNLTSLNLSSCSLYGNFPERILQLKNLQTLDISMNTLLCGSLPEFPTNGSLQNLALSGTCFSGYLPESIGNLQLLTKLEISSCSFNGSVPSSILNLSRLNSLDLSCNNFTGPIPSLPEKVTQVNLAHNHLTGPLVSSHWERLLELVNLDLKNNSLQGMIPSSLFTLPSLQKLQLAQNQFDGELVDFPDLSLAPLDTLDLSSNKLEGLIPLSIFEFRGLQKLILSSNNFSGTLQLEIIHKLPNLYKLDLSYNSLSITTKLSNSISQSFPQIAVLKLASCKLRAFPEFLRINQSRLIYLDLSVNQLHGKLPSWVWKIGDWSLGHLNLSCNFLNDLERPLPIFTGSPLAILDLHSNLFKGPVPILSSTPSYLDFSNNRFSSVIPADITPNLVYMVYFSLSSNNLTGEIPSTICDAGYLQVLDLSNNSLSGTIPSCLGAISGTLGVLKLRQNNFTGPMPKDFPDGCDLRTLDVNGNRLEGSIPKSLGNCRKLEVLDLGNNQMTDRFPFWLGFLSSLRVLVLRSNRLYGTIKHQKTNYTFPLLQIVDISSNKFTGELPSESFLSWTGMMVGEDKLKYDVVKFKFLDLGQSNFYYYQDVVTVVSKGIELDLVKILTVFTTIDFSNNAFQGQIPKVIGKLNSLVVLNLSYNAFTSQIPSSLGNLKQLESLDLSHNKLNGKIPEQLASITFLSFLNLSWNKLEGVIPTGSQFQTFTAASFEGNIGLCGAPLSRNCTDVTAAPPKSTKESKFGLGFDWHFALTGLLMGFGAGFGMVVAFFLFSNKGRKFLLSRSWKVGSLFFSCH